MVITGLHVFFWSVISDADGVTPNHIEGIHTWSELATHVPGACPKDRCGIVWSFFLFPLWHDVRIDIDIVVFGYL